MDVVRRSVTLALGLMLSVALSGAPASAAVRGVGKLSSLCDPASLGTTPATAIVGRDAHAREPDLGQTHKDLPKAAKGRAPAMFAVTVPVYFHVITDGAVGALTPRQIDAQIAVLNKTFGGREGGTRTGFAFALAGVTRTDDAVWFASRSGGAEHEMKRALKQGGDGALNVYSTSGGALLGWAYLPEITDTAQAYLDGIVVSWETVPGASATYAGQFDLGETLTHEAGHWLNLEHTFFGGCNKSGDFVDDTPAQKTPTSGCPVGKDTCPAPGLDPVHNYMDYSFDTCYTEFTAGQTQRMRDSWLLYRAS
ncbi:MAG TPA: zinc metalloprotease [Micromonosporaceae bacterium]